MKDITVDTQKHEEVVIVPTFRLYQRGPKGIQTLFELSRRIFQETHVLTVSLTKKEDALLVTFPADTPKEEDLLEEIDRIIKIITEVYKVQIQGRLF